MANMEPNVIRDVLITPLKIIPVAGGDVFHAMKRSDAGFAGFSEAYFSTIEHEAIKPWKRHREMTLNIVVPAGEIRFVIFDDRLGSESFGVKQEVRLSKDNYCRLTVPPMLWMAFQGIHPNASILLNVADIEHDPSEVDRVELDSISYDWRI